MHMWQPEAHDVKSRPVHVRSSLLRGWLLLLEILLLSPPVLLSPILLSELAPSCLAAASPPRACSDRRGWCVTTETRPLDRLGQPGEFEQDRGVVCTCPAHR